MVNLESGTVNQVTAACAEDWEKLASIDVCSSYEDVKFLQEEYTRLICKCQIDKHIIKSILETDDIARVQSNIQSHFSENVNRALQQSQEVNGSIVSNVLNLWVEYAVLVFRFHQLSIKGYQMNRRFSYRVNRAYLAATRYAIALRAINEMSKSVFMAKSRDVSNPVLSGLVKDYGELMNHYKDTSAMIYQKYNDQMKHCDSLAALLSEIGSIQPLCEDGFSDLCQMIDLFVKSVRCTEADLHHINNRYNQLTACKSQYQDSLKSLQSHVDAYLSIPDIQIDVDSVPSLETYTNGKYKFQKLGELPWECYPLVPANEAKHFKRRQRRGRAKVDSSNEEAEKLDAVPPANLGERLQGAKDTLTALRGVVVTGGNELIRFLGCSEENPNLSSLKDGICTFGKGYLAGASAAGLPVGSFFRKQEANYFPQEQYDYSMGQPQYVSHPGSYHDYYSHYEPGSRHKTSHHI